MTPFSVPSPGKAMSRRQRAAAAIARFVRCEGGGPASEFGLVAAPFICLMLGTLQVGLIYFAQQALETTVEQSARLVLTGQTATLGLTTQPLFAAAVCQNSPGLFNCNNFMIDLQPAASFSAANVSKPVLTFDANGNVTNTWQYNVGNPGDIMVMRVMYQWPVFLGPLALNLSNLSNNNLLIMSTAVFRNEP
jgi:Flp pilus assembly protein TadG